MTHAVTLFRCLLVASLVVGAVAVGHGAAEPTAPAAAKPASSASPAAAVAPSSASPAAAVAPPAGPAGGGPSVAAAAQSNGTLEFTTVNATPGESVTVQLRTDANGMAGYQANVTFDPSRLRVVSVDGADWDAPVYNVDNEAGWVFLTQSRARETDSPALATITFEVVDEVGDTIDLTFVGGDTLVNDADSETIPVALDQGPVRTEPAALGAQGAASGDGQTDDREGTDGSQAEATTGEAADSGGLPDSVLVLGGVGVGAALVVGVLAGKRLG